MEELIIGFLLTAAGAASGLPQMLWSKYGEKLGDAGFSIVNHWNKAKKALGWQTARKQINFEKVKTERAITKLISIVANYESLIQELKFNIKKIEAKDEKPVELYDSLESIEIKLEEAKLKLKQQRENLKELNRFILEIESDSQFYNLDKSDKNENQFIKSKADIDNIRNKKDA